MKFSLILATVNRDKEVKEFLTSISQQIYTNFEVIIVDQNNDNRVLKILPYFKKLDIKYIKSEKGLSKARNRGLKEAYGDIVGFPDDDCLYPKELLENINIFFKEHNYDILMGKTIDKETGGVVAGKNITKAQILKPSLILGSSTTLFIKRDKKNIVFDEYFGIGAKFNAEEENDLLFRLLKKGHIGYYIPDINYVYHPPSDLDYTNTIRAKQRAIGLGAFIAKHIYTKEGIIYFFKYNVLRPFLGTILYILRFDFVKSKYYFNRWLGIWQGFFKYLRVKYETDI
ncbi:glycosyltransferase [Sulfurimonas sp.]|uniref:glycosyltransferase family 2 protein n=1 Tax=Sulfurimonas sp. TaxID=2022749 RepID=UPI002627D5E6|nr:glycosyltransferase [Sulfurimonas sp.]